MGSIGPSLLWIFLFHSCYHFFVSNDSRFLVNLWHFGVFLGLRAKNLLATILFVDSTKAFDSIHRGKMEQSLLAYDLPKKKKNPKKPIAAIMILYRNTKVKVRFPDGDTDYFDIVAGEIQRDTLLSYLFIICLDYVLRTLIDNIKENSFELTKKRSRG